MGPRIAILLSGVPSDLPVSLCAVQLAARTESELHAVQDDDQLGLRHCEAPLAYDSLISSAYSLQDSFRFVGELAGPEGVPVSYHVLERGAADPLGEFLIVHAISCLVVYVDPQQLPVARLRWIEALQQRLTASARWFHGSLRVLVAPPWTELEFAAALTRLRHAGPGAGNSKIKQA